MNFVAKNIPLWSVTTWDKKFTGVDKSWQPKTIKYKYLLSAELDALNVGGDVNLLYTGKDTGSTTEELAGDAVSEGEIVSIPWGGTPSVKYFNGKFVTGDNRIATSNIPEELLNKYLYYFMKGRIVEIGSYYRGAGLKHPAMKSVLSMKISYPTVEEQKAIIARFEAIERMVDGYTEMLEKLDELVKSRFVEMFGDDGENELVRLKDVCSVITDGTHQAPKFKSEGVPFLFVSNIANNAISYNTEKFISQDDYETLIRRTPIEIGDVLVSAVGSFGHPAIVRTEKPFCFQRHIAYLKPMRELIDSNFLHAVLLSDESQRYMDQSAKGVAQRTVTLKSFKEMVIPLPPIEQQQDFAAFVQQVDKLKFAAQQQIEKLQELYDSLAQEYFGA